jgi:CheY-like chemotaxis protein
MKSKQIKRLEERIINIVHEVNNVLTGIIGWTEIGLKNPKNLDLILDTLNTIKKNSLRTKELIGNLMDIPCQRSKRLKKQQLQHIIEDVLKLLSWNFHHQKIKIEKNFSPCPEIAVDQIQIYEVFLNLAMNSIHAMPNGGKLKINIYSCDQKVVVEFQDSGYGIDKKDIKKIFTPFFSTKRNSDFTQRGIGLTIAKEIINAHGGEIRVVAEPGKGSTFSVVLPIKTSIKTSKSPSDKEKDKAFRVSSSGYEVLVIDDEYAIREMLKTALNLQGIGVTAVSNGDEALLCYQKKRFDVLFLDLSLSQGSSPKMILEEIKKIDPDIPIFLMSGRTIDKKCGFKQEEISGWIQKPFELSEIYMAIKKVIPSFQFSD